MMRRILSVAATTGALMLIASASFADDCENVSRAPAACGSSCTTVVTVGNWVWLPSLVNIGVTESLPYAWGFATPGSGPSQGLEFPGSSGNYLNDRGGDSWLLENSVCVNGNTARQTTNGVQTGCGE